MLKNSRYRSYALAAGIVSALAFTGCADANKKHTTLKEEQYSRWNNTRVSVMYQLAQQQYAAAEHDKARATLAKSFALKTDHAPSYVLAAKIEIESGSLELAAEYLKAANRGDPNNPEPSYLLGVVYQRWQKNDVAHDYYRAAYDKKPTEPLYLLAVAEMKITLGKVDEAQALLEDRLVYFEQTAAVRVALAKIHSLKGDHLTACKYYRDAVVLLPEDQAIRQTYAETLFFAGKYAEALPLFEELRKNPDALNHDNLSVMLGQTYMALKRPIDARNTFQEVCRTNPNNTGAFLNLGKVCIQTNDLSLGLSAARHVIKREPENVHAMMLMALIQQKQKKWADAQATLLKAQKIAPNDSTILCMLGVNAQELGQSDKAVSYFEKAIEANPKDAWAQDLLSAARPVATGDSVEPPLQQAP